MGLEILKEKLEEHEIRRKRRRQRAILLLSLSLLFALIAIIFLLLELFGIMGEAGIALSLVAIVITIVISIFSTQEIRSTMSEEAKSLEESFIYGLGGLGEEMRRGFEEISEILKEIRNKI